MGATVSQKGANGAQKEPSGAKRVPKVSQRVTKLRRPFGRALEHLDGGGFLPPTPLRSGRLAGAPSKHQLV